MNKIFNGKMRELTPDDLNKKYTKRMMLSSVMIPSQYQAYSICVEFARDWFLEKFNKNFFTNVHIDGKFAFDDFRRFSITDDKLKRINPLLAIFPVIQMDHNRNWIDSYPEIPLMLRRTKMEGCFFNDEPTGLHAQIIFKTILMNFVYKMRVNTRAEELDLFEFIKIKHRAGYTETKEVSIDIHVPKELIAQIAYDNEFKFDDNLNIENPTGLLKYLNSHSLIPFIYKMRCVNGNNEFFIKVPNCVAHLKMEMPTMDDGERSGVNSTNYTIDFNVEVEMSAPFSYTYYSQKEQKYITDREIISDGLISVMKSAKTTIPDKNSKGWSQYTTTEYMIDETELNKDVEIDFNELFNGADIIDIINYTKSIAINPAVFIDMKIFNDAKEVKFDMDWNIFKCKINSKVTNITLVIGIYIDLEYVNNVLINLKEMNSGRIK